MVDHDGGGRFGRVGLAACLDHHGRLGSHPPVSIRLVCCAGAKVSLVVVVDAPEVDRQSDRTR